MQVDDRVIECLKFAFESRAKGSVGIGLGGGKPGGVHGDAHFEQR